MPTDDNATPDRSPLAQWCRQSGAVSMRFVRVGYVRALLLADAFLILLLVYDAARLRFHGISVSTAHANASLSGLPSAHALVKICLFMLLALPGALTLLRMAFNRGSRVHGRLAMEIGPIGSALHVVVTVVCAIGGAVVTTAETLGGYQWTRSSGWESVFVSAYGIYAAAAGSTVILLGTVFVAVVISPAIAYLSRETKPSPYVVDLLSRLYLLDLRGDLYPTGYSPRRANFMAGAISPGIRVAAEEAVKLVHGYNTRGPGSPEATAALVGMARECVDIIRRRVISGGDDADLHIGFTSNTTRALELAVVLSGNAEAVVLSPFEHPSEARVSEWLGRTLAVEVVQAEQTREMFARPPSQITDDIVLAVAAAIDKAKHDRICVLLSDVCWSTGVRLPTSNIIDGLRRLCSNRHLTFVIDGAHAAGNNALVSIPEEAHAYVFSGHKWLFSNEPVGVIITRRPWAEPFPVDVWIPKDGMILPSIGTAGPFKLAHLTAVLRMFEKHGMSTFWERSRELRQRFVAALPQDIVPVGWTPSDDRRDHSFIVTVAPTQGRNWFTSSITELASYFERRRVSLNVLRIPGFAPVLRVTFPYFLPVRDMEKLAKALGGALNR